MTLLMDFPLPNLMGPPDPHLPNDANGLVGEVSRTMGKVLVGEISNTIRKVLVGDPSRYF